MKLPQRLMTSRLMLRRVQADDAASLHRIFSNHRAMRFWSHPAYDEQERTQELIAQMELSSGVQSDEFVLEFEDQVIGKAGAWQLPEIGFILHPDHWGKGLMQEALHAILPHLFAHHAVPALLAEADPRNAASIKLLVSLGFSETHRAEKTMQWGEEWCDSIYFRLPAP